MIFWFWNDLTPSDRAFVPVWPRAYCKVFFMLTHLLMGGLHESRKNLREKDFPLVDVENLEMEGVLKERCFWSNENKVLWNCSVKDYYLWRKNMLIGETENSHIFHQTASVKTNSESVWHLPSVFDKWCTQSFKFKIDFM